MRPDAFAQTLWLRVVGRSVQVVCPDTRLRALVQANFAALLAPAPAGPPDLRYVIVAGDARHGHRLVPDGATPVVFGAAREVLFHLEKALVVALQRQRADLLFLHAAVLERAGRAFLLAGASGAGKSTATWGLLHHGFHYLSDELAPIDLQALQVLPYPHALCLKQVPPRTYPLPPAGVLDLGETLHLPVSVLPAPAVDGPRDLAAVLFVRWRPGAARPALRAIEPAETAARLYAATLNALAHPVRGLGAVARIATRVPGFVLDGADLGATCRRVEQALRRVAAAPPIIGHGPAVPVQCPPRLRPRRAARRRLVLARTR